MRKSLERTMRELADEPDIPVLQPIRIQSAEVSPELKAELKAALKEPMVILPPRETSFAAGVEAERERIKTIIIDGQRKLKAKGTEPKIIWVIDRLLESIDIAPVPITVDTAAEAFERETADAVPYEVTFDERLEHERMEPTGHMFDNAPRESENEEDDDATSA